MKLLSVSTARVKDRAIGWRSSFIVVKMNEFYDFALDSRMIEFIAHKHEVR